MEGTNVQQPEETESVKKLDTEKNKQGEEKDKDKDGDIEDPPCIWDHYYKFCGVKVLIHEDYDAGLGGTMFDGALCLCNYVEHLVEREQKQFKLSSVVELGAGCGLPGLLLAGLGARVVLTDIGDTVALLKENIDNNEALFERGCGEASAAVLDWTNKTDLVKFKPPYDYILAADTIYSDEAVVAFLETAHFLAGPETVVLFAHPAPRQPDASQLFWNKVDDFFHVEKVQPGHFVPNIAKQPKSFASPQRGVFLLKKRAILEGDSPRVTELESKVASLST